VKIPYYNTPIRKEDDMVKFISGLIVGLICGVLITMAVPISPTGLNRCKVARTGNLQIKEAGFTKIIMHDEDPETFYKSMAATLDQNTQAKWEKITSDPVWDQLADEDKMNIWDAFEKTYIPTKGTGDNTW